MLAELKTIDVRTQEYKDRVTCKWRRSLNIEELAFKGAYFS